MACPNTHSIPKLANLCLNVITSNFDRFMGAYSSADKVLAKNFEFLQRAYSKDLFKELANTDHFLKYMNFLLNEHLKEVNVGFCHESCDHLLVVERLKSIGKGIRIINLSGYVYTAEVLVELMHKLPKIKSLTLSSVHVNDDVLRVIGEHCPSLGILILNNCYEVTDLGIMSLSPMDANEGSVRKKPKLKELDISETSVSVIGIAFALTNFPNLTMIHHDDVLTAIYNIHADDIKNNSVQLCEPYKLTELMIDYEGKYMNIEFVKMCPLLCPHVTKLTISNVTSQTQIDACVEFKELKDVYFASTFGSASFSSFIESRGKSLESLHARDGNISVVPLLKFCLKLKRLNLENTNFEHFDTIPDDVLRNKFQHLKLLSLDGMNFGLEAVAKSVNCILSSSPNLETLSFIYAESLGVEFVDSIIKHDCMTALREIDVNFSDIKFPAVQKLIHATPSLSSCFLQQCDLSYDDFMALECMRPDLKFEWRTDASEYSDYDNVYDGYDDMFDNDYDYFDYDSSDNDYDYDPSYFTNDDFDSYN